MINHREAFDHLLSYQGDMSRKLVFDLHTFVMKNTLRSDLQDQIGAYRKVQVHIRGVEWMPPAPEHVPKDMSDLFSWYTRNKGALHPVVLASYFHVGFYLVLRSLILLLYDYSTTFTRISCRSMFHSQPYIHPWLYLSLYRKPSTLSARIPVVLSASHDCIHSFQNRHTSPYPTHPCIFCRSAIHPHAYVDNGMNIMCNDHGSGNMNSVHTKI